MQRIQNNSQLVRSGTQWSWNFPEGSHVVPCIPEAPSVNIVYSGCDDHSVIDLKLRGSSGRPCTGDQSPRLGIAAGGAIKDHDPAVAGHQQDIVHWIHTYRGVRTYFRIGPAQNTNGLDVSVRFPRKYQDSMEPAANENFVIDRIDGDPVHAIGRAYDLGARPLDDPKGRFLSTGPATEYKDRLSERTAYNNFIVNRIVGYIVHRPAEPRKLTFQFASGNCILLRQPGESRNLRVHHSVRHQDFLPVGVIRDGCGPAESQR